MQGEHHIICTRKHRAANGQKWDDFRAAVELAWHDLDAAFKAIKS